MRNTYNKNIKSRPSGLDHSCAAALYVGRYEPMELKHV